MGFLPDNFEIAPGHRVSEWRSLTLDATDCAATDWNRAITILESRIRSRFIEPVQVLLDAENGEERGKFGFAILAIDFLLIETIEGFRTGLTCHQRHSKALFKSFLTAWPAFISCIPAGKNADDLSYRVFEQGRCALHHTGSTDRIVVRRNGKMFIFQDDDRIEINRTLLHQELVAAFSKYTEDLRLPECVDLRQKFKRKMDHICQ